MRNDIDFSKKLLAKKGVACCPGSYFGKNGKGYIRFSFATDKKTIKIGLNLFKEFILNKEYR